MNISHSFKAMNSERQGRHQIDDDEKCWTDRIGDTDEPRCEKTGLRGFRPGPTQTGLCSHIRWLEA